MTGLLLTNLLVVLGLLVLLWAYCVKIKDVSLIDMFWGTGFVVVVWVSYFVANFGSETVDQRLLLVCLLTTIWGARLSLYLFWRNHGKPEDYRYAAMREKHGARFWWVSLLTVFLLQGILLWFVSLPVQVVAGSEFASLGWLDGIGAAVWAIGFIFESVGDYQLARFRSDPANRGKVLETGLWRFTRHPNYFGDFCVWWGLYLIAIGGGGVWMIGSPLLMSFLLIKVSGVRLTEKSISNRRPAYESYKRRTNAFFPWLPKKDDQQRCLG